MTYDFPSRAARSCIRLAPFGAAQLRESSVSFSRDEIGHAAALAAGLAETAPFAHNAPASKQVGLDVHPVVAVQITAGDRCGAA